MSDNDSYSGDYYCDYNCLRTIPTIGIHMRLQLDTLPLITIAAIADGLKYTTELLDSTKVGSSNVTLVICPLKLISMLIYCSHLISTPLSNHCKILPISINRTPCLDVEQRGCMS